MLDRTNLIGRRNASHTFCKLFIFQLTLIFQYCKIIIVIIYNIGGVMYETRLQAYFAKIKW